MNTKKIKLGVIFLAGFFMLFFAYGQEVKEWLVPDEYKTMKNPVESNQESLKLGKMLYSKHCKYCHGKEGLGDGAKSKTLETFCGDFSSEEFQDQTDGALYYKTTEGRDEMPSFKQSIDDDEDRWCIINYLRTLK